MPSRFVDGVYPKLLTLGMGAVVVDADSIEYVDMIAGLGAISLGYCNKQVNGAVRNQLLHGISFSLPNFIESVVADELCRLIPPTEMWKYGKNGTDATLMAIRAARALTGRTKILVSGYHGCTDHFECLGTRQAGMIDMGQWTYRKYDDRFPYFNDFAAFITEPDTTDLVAARKWCDEVGALLIIDEVITGGRTKHFTYSRMSGVIPDLICVGKGLANGFPLSAVGGKRDVMKVFEREDFFASMTFGGECVSLSACLATLKQLEHKIDYMIDIGTKIKEYFNSLFLGRATCDSYPTRLIFKWPTVAHKALFMQTMCESGVLTGYSNFIMADTTEQDMTHLINALSVTADILTRHWENPEGLLKGPLPQEVIRR